MREPLTANFKVERVTGKREKKGKKKERRQSWLALDLMEKLRAAPVRSTSVEYSASAAYVVVIVMIGRSVAG